MKDTIVIDGVTYDRRNLLEAKKVGRREFWIEYREDDGYAVNEDECGKQLSGPREIYHVVEIRANERVLSEDDVRNAWSRAGYRAIPTDFLKGIGFWGSDA